MLAAFPEAIAFGLSSRNIRLTANDPALPTLTEQPPAVCWTSVISITLRKALLGRTKLADWEPGMKASSEAMNVRGVGGRSGRDILGER